ncbi:hypothetical protein [Lichenifustis flavocetrariae]|uniref:Uncharacterized protein n=1 Tax=Lichenifustis flavocetrariae TaxID=2949735 RepID=A0AA41YRS3_9HYPH|nr:hypothetical protein [Lichenifustis flavocetrariae]MCW6506984.1 hypothetical protein [Lichenifustis flavocetrariae]MCW6509704.1 hypothetical protein [Lichenifustis flavocetrariae]
MSQREFYKEGDGEIGSRFFLVHDLEHGSMPVHVLHLQTTEHDTSHATSETAFILSLPDFLHEKSPAQGALLDLIATLAASEP